MKVAVYTIAKNEEQFVEKWYESAKEADYLLIADTGSSDNTVKKAKKLKINVFNISINPWRFDDARNASLALIPDDIDYCIALDMDEVLLPGWREELEKAHKESWTRPRYRYTWSWNLDGTPGLQYGGDKIHSRHGYRWKHPVHEVLTADRIKETQGWTTLEINHHPDNTKSRGQYLPLLELSVLEDPYDDRNAYYFARELFFNGQYREAALEFERHLSLPKAVWKPERAASMRYIAKCRPEDAKLWLVKAIEEDPNRREPLVDLAMWSYENREWALCLSSAKKALEIKEKPLDYLCEDFAWRYLPYDLAAIALYNMGDFKEALKYGKKALNMNPTNERLKNNLEFYSAV
jgi:glycosyltransferase involved in cell wall biosynthesis